MTTGRVRKLLVLAVVAVACRDQTVVAPLPVAPRVWIATAVQCDVAVGAAGASTATCQSGASMRGENQAAALAEARRMAPTAASGPLKPMDLVTLGSQGVQISLTLEGTIYNAATQRVTATAVLRNLLDQPLGRDSTVIDAAGVRLFFESPPAADTGTVTIGNADGTGTFASGTNLPYFVFHAPIPAGLDEHREFQFNLAGGARRFTFRVLVSATVPDEASPYLSGAPLVFTEVVAGERSGCAVRSLGTLYCWGANDYGGVGQVIDSVYTVPTPIPGRRFQRVRHGLNYACGIGESGDLWCWGYLRHVVGPEQLVTTPMSVPFNRPVTEIAAGDEHLCVLDDRGAAYCRGQGDNGELGDGTYTDPNNDYVSYWTAVGGGLRFATLAAGSFHTCGVTVGGALYCWGSTDMGQTGNASPNPDGEAWPTRVTTPAWTSGSRWTQVAVGFQHSCALNSAGEAFCWGRGVEGQVGDSVFYNETYSPKVDTPQRVRGDTSVRFTAISSGTYHACALTVGTRRLWCWGYNAYGEQGDSASGNFQYYYAHPAAGTRTFSDLALGASLTCGTVQGGGPLGLHCMGSNEDAGLGIGTRDIISTRDVPTLVSQSTGFTDLSLGLVGGACAKATNGRHYCWGNNNNAQLGRSPRIIVSRPAGMFNRVALHGIVPLYIGGYCALSSTGAPYCWGTDPAGIVKGAVPDSVPTTLKFASLSSGGMVVCGLTSVGNAYCWGTGAAVGSSGTFTVPTALTMPGRTFLSISVSRLGTRACAISNDGEIYCWGNNNGGSLLGAASDTVGNTPVTVPVRFPVGLLRFKQVSVSQTNICALSTLGEAYCWGTNGYGAIGDGVVRPYYDVVSTPTKVANGLFFSDLQATTNQYGYGRACGLTTSGTAYCWGYGPLGIPAYYYGNTTSVVPRRVETDVQFERLSLGADHTCGLTANGAVWCWGANDFGQIGNGENQPYATLPVRLAIP